MAQTAMCLGKVLVSFGGWPTVPLVPVRLGAYPRQTPRTECQMEAAMLSTLGYLWPTWRRL